MHLSELRDELIEFIRAETQKYQEERDDALITQALENGFELNEGESSPNCLFQLAVDQSESFANKFSFVMQNSPCAELAELMRRQIAMANEMNQIIRVRNWEVTQLRNKCESAVNDASSNVDVHPHELSKLNEKLRNLHASYACQVEGLSERHREDFRKNIQQKTGENEVSEGLNESYTIYIGAQLKSMHNVRLLTARSMVELCAPVKNVDVSSLLQMSISLYGKQLSGLVMLVPRDPLWHSNSGSEFARVCEQSTELHFEPLGKQLKGIVESVGYFFLAVHAKWWREESERRKSAASGDSSTKAAHDTALEVGDVYCTRHSNLRDVQLVFHLVVDDALQSSDISSRHPCLNGIRNIIRLTVRLGITTIHIPLLLVEQASESGELQVCGVCGGSAVGGGVTSVPHFNIHLVLPSGLVDGVYQQISAMFPTIFHLVPSVSMALQEP
ncbi:unnamed protein product [Nippostrongylus brasiliensis]|uniref:Uncharacterized protein n=1 Tax=Nippostrongylus brasiliensis TaxID=27835 RepID=A0A3P7BSE3_NIPBR|nr:unnamed protein product [Nippostrongylus brasiliensis]